MISLSLRFIGVQHKLSYRLALEIGLVVALLVITSGIITGVSNQFASLIVGRKGSQDYFVGIEHAKTLEQSHIPISIIESLDASFVRYFTPFLIYPIVINNSIESNYFFVDFSELIRNKDSFFLNSGKLSISDSDILIGQGLALQLGIENKVPQDITFMYNGSQLDRTIVGIVEDTGPWYYGFLDDFANIWTNLTHVSAFEFQIKNNKVLPVYTQQLNILIQELNLSIQIDIIELNQAINLSRSFNEGLKALFTILLQFCFLFLFLKLFHSSYTLYFRLQHDFWICKIVGMSRRQLQTQLWEIISIIGNIGIIFGFLVGFVLPQFLVLSISPFFDTQNLNIIPALDDLIIVMIFSNILFFINSFWIYTPYTS